jgi:hypothetical protein
LPTVTLSVTPTKRDRLGFIYHHPSSRYDFVALAVGF